MTTAQRAAIRCCRCYHRERAARGKSVFKMACERRVNSGVGGSFICAINGDLRALLLTDASAANAGVGELLLGT